MIRRLLLSVVFIAVAASLAHAQKGPLLPPHDSTLTWTNPQDPSGTTIVGSNVYRCTGTCGGSALVLLTTTPLSATTVSYVDTAVTANTTYSWAVTNLVTISTGTFETSFSNIVTATIPKDAASAPTLNAPVTQ